MDDFNAARPLIEKIGKALLDPQNTTEGEKVSMEVRLKAGKEKSVLLPKGEAALRALVLKLGSYENPEVTRSVVLKIEFDEEESIWTPVGDFFGTGIGLNPFKGWYQRVDEDGTMSCRWVMPYQKSGKISVVNLGDEPVDIFCGLIVLIAGCNRGKPTKTIKPEKLVDEVSNYEGTASITQGFTKATVDNIYECAEGRNADMGVIKSTDGKEWTVPASTNFTNKSFPTASDLHNPCNGNSYANVREATSNLDGSDIIEIDTDGDLFTTYIFADNYFEMYVNGIPVGKDKVPFTKFNSSLVRFKANRPFTIAMKLVDWEEALGLGTEKNRSSDFHAGDGGMVAVIKDMNDSIIAITNENWKAQTFYTSPIKDLSCVKENGLLRTSQNCDKTDSNDATSFYGLHWALPLGWEKANFDDSNWPDATTYMNNTIGVDNKNAYANFTDIFDKATNDAKFIWSTNVVLDNEVIVRHTVKKGSLK